MNHVKQNPAMDVDSFHRDVRSGRLWIVSFIVAVLVLMVGAGWYFWPSPAEGLGRFGKTVNSLRRDHFDLFWECSVGTPRPPVPTNVELEKLIQGFAREEGVVYSDRVRKECLPKLEHLVSELRSLIPPQGLAMFIDEELAATIRLQRSWEHYCEDLRLSPKRDDNRKLLIHDIGKAWHDYLRIHAAFNHQLKKMIADYEK